MDRVGAIVARLGSELGVMTAACPVEGWGRRAERAAGQAAARVALRAAGGDGLGVEGHHPDGRPCWPAGWTGSIAHTSTHAVAAISALRAHDAVGIDIEERRGLTLDDAALVLGADERTVASRSSDPSDMATTLWSAKEAAFKAWSSVAGGLPGVDPVDISITLRAGTFSAIAVGDLAARDHPLDPLTGRFELLDELVTTLVVSA